VRTIRRGLAPAGPHNKEHPMPQLGRIVYGWMPGPGFHRPVRAMVLYRLDGSRVWKSVTALRWVPLPRGATFTPDAKQPHEA
jgi:hypothetical protein